MQGRFLKAALEYAEKGYPVFPCRSGEKNPITSNGVKDASLDPEKIRKFWTDHPDANIGLDCRGLLAIDVDGAENPYHSKFDAVQCPVQRTPKGGKHYIFKLPSGKTWKNSVSRLADNVDIRTGGGYLIVSPSVFLGRGYQFFSDLPPKSALPPPPGWLIAELDALDKPAAKTTGEKTTWNEIREGRRNAELTKRAGILRRSGLNEKDIFDSLMKINREFLPPLDEKEVRGIAASVCRYEPEGEPEAILKPFSEIEPEVLQWLWSGRIPSGKITILFGDPGLGKSWVGLHLASVLSRGGKFPDGATCEQGSAIFLSFEDDAADTLRPRLDNLGADVSKVHCLYGVRLSGGQERCFTLEDMKTIEKAADNIQNLRLIVIDPITAAMGRTDSHKNSDVRVALAPVNSFAQKTGAAVLMISHLNKAGGSNALYRATGSLAFTAAARAAWLVTTDPDDESKRLFLPAKNNLAPDLGGLAFGLDKEKPCPFFWHENFRETRTADAVMAAKFAKKPNTENRREVDEWLSDFMKENGGEVAAKDVYEAALEGEGFTKSQLKAAKKRLGIEAKKGGFDGGWTWHFFDTDAFIDGKRQSEGTPEGIEGAGNKNVVPSVPSSVPSARKVEIIPPRRDYVQAKSDGPKPVIDVKFTVHERGRK